MNAYISSKKKKNNSNMSWEVCGIDAEGVTDQDDGPKMLECDDCEGRGRLSR